MQNVLCHYNPLGRKEIMQNIIGSLNPGGFFVGDSTYTLYQAAKDPVAFEQWYGSLEQLGLQRVKLLVKYARAESEIDDTNGLYVYQKIG